MISPSSLSDHLQYPATPDNSTDWQKLTIQELTGKDRKASRSGRVVGRIFREDSVYRCTRFDSLQVYLISTASVLHTMEVVPAGGPGDAESSSLSISIRAEITEMIAGPIKIPISPNT